MFYYICVFSAVVTQVYSLTSCERRRLALLEAQARGQNVAAELKKPCPFGSPDYNKVASNALSSLKPVPPPKTILPTESAEQPMQFECIPLVKTTSGVIPRNPGGLQQSIQYAVFRQVLNRPLANREPISADDFCYEVCTFNGNCVNSAELSFCMGNGYCYGLYVDVNALIAYQPLRPVCYEPGLQRVECGFL
jgi:hypothetical protein